MRIATWNINGLRARFDFLLHWLRARQPDLVGLQELKLIDESFPYAELEAAGYHALAHTQKAWNGVAILSRERAEIRQKGLPGEEELGARLITASVGGLLFTTVYCPNGKQVGHPDFSRKLKWLGTLAEFVKERHHPDEPMILCGDLNLCPTALDTWNEGGLRGEIFHTDEERARFQSLLDLRLFDLYRHFLPEGRMFSWWDYRAGAFHKNQGLRIDFLLGTQVVLERVQTVEIDREYRKKKEDLVPSDHAPVLADLR
ncbi:MAG: exodeoxyribonuclease III [Acidobacteria bacterium]|nr:exodeoxyribonuclease III [Acidobacteriota bacterium]MCI0720895.1 exodeoxyribonuclease III [Acidobacteriota bacterium]